MKERPILFSGPMVRAIIDGRKTQTRRIVRPDLIEALGDPDTWEPQGPGRWRAWSHHENQNWHFGCPYGRPGDRLWVRETWRTAKSLDEFSPTGIAKKALDAGWKTPWAQVRYEADGAEANWSRGWGEWGKTRVSIHMPRWAVRLTPGVTEVRVQRLQEISEDDAQAEGVERSNDERWPWKNYDPATSGAPLVHARSGFRTLWDSINGERTGCPWPDNPWVWAVSFKVTP